MRTGGTVVCWPLRISRQMYRKGQMGSARMGSLQTSCYHYVLLLLLRSISEISSCFFGPRPWHIEIRHRVKKTSTINLFGFETLKLKIRRLKLWKPTVANRLYLSISLSISIPSISIPVYISVYVHGQRSHAAGARARRGGSWIVCIYSVYVCAYSGEYGRFP